MKEFVGEVNINRTNSNYDNTHPIKISVKDGKSGITIVQAELTLEDFALVLTGMSGLNCRGRFDDTGRAGKVRQYEVRSVFVPRCTYEKRGEIAAAALAPLEIDGWCGSVSDAMNSNRIDKRGLACVGDVSGAYYNVGFERWVDDVPAEVPA